MPIDKINTPIVILMVSSKFLINLSILSIIAKGTLYPAIIYIGIERIIDLIRVTLPANERSFDLHSDNMLSILI